MKKFTSLNPSRNKLDSDTIKEDMSFNPAKFQMTMKGITGTDGTYGSIDISQLEPAPEEWNYFSPLTDMQLQEIKESISNYGVLQPIVVRKFNDKDGYQILAGHNRVSICKQLFEETGDTRYTRIDALVYQYNDIDDEKAKAIIADTNYMGRGKLPKRDTMRYIVNRIKTLKKQMETREGDVMAAIAEKLDISRTQAFRWQKMASLIPTFIDMLADEKLDMLACERLASLTPEIQSELAEKDMELINNKSVRRLNKKMTYRECSNALKAFKREERTHAKMRTIYVNKKPLEGKKLIVFAVPDDWQMPESMQQFNIEYED